MTLFISQLDESGKSYPPNLPTSHFSKTILELLGKEEMTVHDISNKVGFSASTVRKIISELYESKIIEKIGNLKNRTYRKIDIPILIK